MGDKIRDEKPQYHINRESVKISHCHQVKVMNLNILQGKNYYLLIKVEL